MKSKTQDIEQVMMSEYEVTILTAPVYCVEWAAEKIADVKTAKAEVKRANRLREKQGKMPFYAPYGHRLF